MAAGIALLLTLVAPVTMPAPARAAATPAAARAPACLPLSAVRAGMTGYGLTVFAGADPDTFAVRVLGVQRNLRADGSVILVELSGPGLAEAAIPEGMSGSPVFLEGKLAGAVAFSWEGALRPIGGLTPAEELLAVPTTRGGETPDAGAAATPLETLDQDGRGAALAALLWGEPPARNGPGGAGSAAAQAASAPVQTAARAPVPAAPASERWPDPVVLAAQWWPAAAGAGTGAAAGLVPLPVALVGHALGSGPSADEAARGTAGGATRTAGAPAAGGGAAGSAGAGAVGGGAAPLRPGDACVVSLLRGDAELGALGTVTWVQGDDVWLLGHPLLQAGSVELPLATAEIHGLFPSRGMSFKLGSIGRVVGAAYHDLRAGVGGRLHEEAAAVPVSVTVVRPGGEERYEFQAAPERRLLPSLVYWCLYNALLARGDDLSQQTVGYRIETAWREGDRARAPLVLEGVLAGPNSAGEVAPEWAGPVQILLDSRHARLTLTGVTARLEVQPGGGSAAIVGVDGPAVARPGDRLPLVVTVEPRRGAPQQRRVELALPSTLSAGSYRLLVASARDVFALEAERAADLFADRSLDATLEVLARPRSAATLDLVLYAPPTGVLVDGRELPGLPPGVAATLAGGAGPGRVGSTRASVACQQSLPSREALTGAAVLPLTILSSPPTVPREERP